MHKILRIKDLGCKKLSREHDSCCEISKELAVLREVSNHRFV